MQRVQDPNQSDRAMTARTGLAICALLIVGYFVGFAHAYMRYNCERLSDGQGNKWIECNL